MRFRLPDESVDAEGAIGDEETNEMSRKEPEDGELRVLGQVLTAQERNPALISHKRSNIFFKLTTNKIVLQFKYQPS